MKTLIHLTMAAGAPQTVSKGRREEIARAGVARGDDN